MVVVFEIASAENKLQASVVASSAAIFKREMMICAPSCDLCEQNLPRKEGYLKIKTLNTCLVRFFFQRLPHK